MKREFLENLKVGDIALPKEVVDAIMGENGKDIEAEKAKTTQAKDDLKAAQDQLAKRTKDLEELQKTAGNAEATKKALEDLQAKYDKDTADFTQKLADRDYADAVSAALIAEKVSFTSKAAEKSIRDSLMADRVTLKNGVLEGFKDRLDKLRKEDPDAFAPDKPLPKIVAPVGSGGNMPAPEKKPTRAAQLAEQRWNNLYGAPNTAQKGDS